MPCFSNALFTFCAIGPMSRTIAPFFVCSVSEPLPSSSATISTWARRFAFLPQRCELIGLNELERCVVHDRRECVVDLGPEELRLRGKAVDDLLLERLLAALSTTRVLVTRLAIAFWTSELRASGATVET